MVSHIDDQMCKLLLTEIVSSTNVTLICSTLQVFPTTIESIKGPKVTFGDGQVVQFDSIIFATGYKSTVCNWLNGGSDLFNQDGMPKPSFPNHWKGSNGLYCVGFARRGLAGISNDALNVAKDIASKW